MSRTALALVLLAAGSAGAGEGGPVKVLARGPWPHLPTHLPAGGSRAVLTRVIRTEAELARAAGSTAGLTVPRAFGVAALDFRKQMILAVEDGTQPLVGVSGGGPPSAPYAVAVVRVERDKEGEGLTVRWRRLPRGKGQVLTRPLEAVLVERSAGGVKFERLPDPPAEPKLPPAAKEVPVAARALWADGWPPEAPRKEWVVRDEGDLIDPRLRAPEPVLERMRAEAKARYAKALGVAGLDFTKQMIVGVSGGVQPAGTRVEVTGVEVDAGGKTLTVSWKLHPAPLGKADGITHPAEVVLLDRFAGAVRFEEAAPKSLVLDLWPGKVPDEVPGAIGPEKVVMSPKLDRKQVEVTEQTRMVTNVTRPTLTVYRPAREKDTGAAVIVCPGGGYWNLFWELEGEEVAAWLNSLGVTGIVLKYRVPRRPDEPKGEPARRPLQDAQRAVSLVRSKAGDWGLDPRRIGMVGFSAGGHLAIATAAGFGKRTYTPQDAIDEVSCRPDFAILAYPGYLKARDGDGLAFGLRVPEGTPPVFLVHGGDDLISPPEHSLALYLALRRAKVPAELHVYAGAAHDFGVRSGDRPCFGWTAECARWLRQQGFLEAGGRAPKK